MATRREVGILCCVLTNCTFYLSTFTHLTHLPMKP